MTRCISRLFGKRLALRGLKEQLASQSQQPSADAPKPLPSRDVSSEVHAKGEPRQRPEGISEYARWALDPSEASARGRVQCWVGAFANAKDICCDRNWGPKGKLECWDQEYTYEACCGEVNLNHVEVAEEASKRARKVKGQLFALERKLAAVESGLRWFSLVERCAQKRFLDKDFKVCFFGDVRQGSVLLGSFENWETKEGILLSKIGALFRSPYNKDHSVLVSVLRPPVYGNLQEVNGRVHRAMRYAGGQRCPAGPPRSVTVWLTCGADVECLRMKLSWVVMDW